MTKSRTWPYISTIILIAMILGPVSLAAPAQPARAQDGEWNIQVVDDIDVWSTSLVLDSQDNPHIAYSSGLSSLHYAQLSDSGWSKETVDPELTVSTSMALDSADNPHIGYSGFIDANYAHSVGGVWAPIEIVAIAPFVWDCSLVLDSVDQPHMAYSVIVPGPGFGLFYTSRTGGGWQPPQIVFAGSSYADSLALDRNDRPHISYSIGSLIYATWNGTDWIREYPASGDPGIAISTSLARDNNDYPCIVFATIPFAGPPENGRLNYVQWTGTEWVKTVVETTSVVDCCLALDSRNNPHIAYYCMSGTAIGPGDIVTGTLKYAHWTGSAWEIQIIDQETVILDAAAADRLNQKISQQADMLPEGVSAPNDGVFYGTKFSSIAVDSQDLPHISYGSLVPTAPGSLHYAVFTVTPPEQPELGGGHPKSSPPLARPLSTPQMSLQFLTIYPQQASANQPVTISTNVSNTGDQAGNYNVALKINGQVEETRMVSVGPQTGQPVKFTVTRTEPGTYSVNIGDKNGSFVVLGDKVSKSATSSKTMAILIIGLIGVLGIGGLVLLLRRGSA